MYKRRFLGEKAVIMSTTKNVLAGCGAVTFAPTDLNAAALADLAQNVGFGTVVNYPQIADIPVTKLTYFLVHGLLPDASKQRIIQALRHSDQMFRRYAPIVCFVTKGPRHQVVPLVQMGFDEVLFVADGLADMAHRLRDQVEQHHLYVESEHYFGPDRRRIERVDPNDPRRKPGGSPYRKIRVVRDPLSGISTMDMA